MEGVQLMEGLVSLAGSMNSLLLFYQLMVLVLSRAALLDGILDHF